VIQGAAVRAVLDGDVFWPPQARSRLDEAKAASEGLASLTPQQPGATMVCEFAEQADRLRAECFRGDDQSARDRDFP
jgi:hypothetical protein